MAVTINGSGVVTGLASGNAGVGKILQVVRSTDVTNRTTTSTTYVDANLSVTITPTYASSTILVVVTGYLLVNRTTAGTNMRGLLQITNSANTALSGAQECIFGTFRYSDSGTSSPIFDTTVNITGYSAPASTSAETYKLRWKCDASNNLNLVNSGLTAQIIAYEVAA